MEKIISELRTSDLIINLANDLMQYVSVNALYGKDITSAIDAMTIIAEKMQYQLREIPTREQKEAKSRQRVGRRRGAGAGACATRRWPAAPGPGAAPVAPGDVGICRQKLVNGRTNHPVNIKR